MGGLAFWERKPEPRPSVVGDGASAEALNAMMAARMDVLRATFKARAAFLRAQASVTDSGSLRSELETRAEEVDFLLGQVQ
jgi:hypothetical protein